VSKPSSAANIKTGYTYKIASIADSPVYTGTLKVGDTMIAAKNAPAVTSTWVADTDWNIIPSGDEPSGTVMSITASNGLKTASGSAITDTGDVQANLASTTALSGNTIYNVGLNNSGNLAVKVPTVSKTAVGLTPQLPNESSTTKFLRQDGSWEVPAYTTVAEGSANGTVKVNGADVSVHGLGTAAYTASTAYATSSQGGKADTAIQSAGTGLSASGTTLNHSNSVTAKTTQGFAQIAYDAQGHITGSTAATTAQADAINSGITSTDVAQITMNKTNILLIEEANGAKNFINPTIAQTVTRTDGGANITITRNADNSLTINGTMGSSNIAVGIESSKKFPAGQYVFSGVPSASVDGLNMYISYSGGYYATIGAGQKTATVTFNSGSTYGTAILFHKNLTGTTYTFNNLTLYPMIQTKASYDAGFTDYQPYALPNTELTSGVLSIQSIVTEKALAYTPDSYIATGDVGTTISLTPTANASWCHILITDPPAGMAYKITGTGGQNPRVWSFVGEDLKVIGSASENETVTDYVLEVPFGTKYVIINSRYANPYSAKTADISERVSAVTADIQSEFGAVCVLRKVKNATETYTYTMATSDFAVTPSQGSCGTYLISIVPWSTSPTYSMYTASYTGGNTTTYNVVQKIAGADANVTCTNGVITVTSSGKVQIYALR